MKKLTESQKKWALAGGLTTVLSFNLVMSLAGSDFKTANFASQAIDAQADKENADKADKEAAKAAKEAKAKAAKAAENEEDFKVVKNFDTDDGVHNVLFVRSGDKTLALISKETESGTCYSCGPSKTLAVDFSSNVNDLKVALRKALKENSGDLDTSASKADKVAKVVHGRKDKDAQDSDQSEDKDLADLQKRCDNKDDDDRMNCFGNGLTRILHDKKKEHSKEDVMALYKKEIALPLVQALTDMNDTDRRDNAQDLIQNMLNDVDKKYNYLRQSLLKLSAKVVSLAEADAQNRLKMAQQMKSTNPMYAMQLQQQGMMRRSLAENLAMNLDSTVQSGLDSAYMSKYLTDTQATTMYTQDYQGIVNNVIQGMRLNPYTYSIPVVDIGTGGYGTDTLTFSASGPINQLQSTGHGVIVIANGLSPQNSWTPSSPVIPANSSTGQNTAVIRAISPSQLPAGATVSQAQVAIQQQQQRGPAPAVMTPVNR